MTFKNLNKILLSVIILISIHCNGWAQTYGLYFSGPEVQKDLRTGLNLSAFKKIQFNSEITISFDLMFRTLENKHFGFIARYIFDETTNLDFIYDNREGKNNLLVVIEDQLHELNIPVANFKNEWIPVQFDFKKEKNQLIISLAKQSQSVENIDLSDRKNLQLLFGAVPNGDFTTSDVPAMNIKNVVIMERKRLQHKWILNEVKGAMATDLKSDTKGKVYNPEWLTQKHSSWDETKSLEIPGRVGVSFDHENIQFICNDKIVQLNILSRDTLSRRYKNNFHMNVSDPGSIFICKKENQVYSFSPNQDSILTIFPDQFNSQSINKTDSISDYFHFNKYYHEKENRLVIFGGLVNNRYTNSLLEYDFNNKKWEAILPLQQASIPPRYLSALGRRSETNTFYILGGYGSSSGDPVKNAHHYKNLLSVNLDNKQINKILEYPQKENDFSFANSMIFPSSENDFYALRFSSHKFNSELQLVNGNVENNKLTEVGNKIPYTFKAKQSYADLFYSESLNLFLAVTIYHDDNDLSHIKVYSIYSPPNKSQTIIQNTENRKKAWYWLILILSFDVVLFIGFLVRKKIQEKNKAWIKSKEAQKRKELELLLRKQSEGEKPRSSIFLFGGFQVFDSNGKDISKLFTPLLKELFLIILLYPFKNGKGISSDKLIETFWFDKQSQKASNNKAVNIGKLRKIMDMVGSYQISNKNGYYTLDFNIGTPNVYVDILEFRDMIQEDILNKEDLLRLLKIIQKGTILSFLNNEWLDEIKEKISSRIIDVLIDQLQTYSAGSDVNIVLNISDSILIFDPLNENAISEKCRVLISLGNHGMAQKTFQKFVTDYELLYDTTYNKTLKNII